MINVMHSNWHHEKIFVRLCSRIGNNHKWTRAENYSLKYALIWQFDRETESSRSKLLSSVNNRRKENSLWSTMQLIKKERRSRCKGRSSINNRWSYNLPLEIVSSVWLIFVSWLLCCIKDAEIPHINRPNSEQVGNNKDLFERLDICLLVGLLWFVYWSFRLWEA